jgi:hypothetical protein
MIDIHNIDGSVLLQADITSPAKREEEMSKSDYISLSWTMDKKVVLPVGAYINHDYKINKVRTVTRQFLLLEAYEPTQTDEMTWKYTPQFQHPKMVLSKVPFYLRAKNSQNEEIKQHVWSFVGTMQVMAQHIADFLNKEINLGNSGWVCQYDVTNKNTINVSFSDNDFISALSTIVNALDDNVSWHIDYDNEVVYLGKGAFEESDVVLKVGKNVGPPSISNSKENYYNSFAVFGGSRNITQVNNKGENISASDIRLQLAPNKGVVDIDGISYPYTIDEYSTVDLRKSTNEQQFTKVLDFSQIFPSLNTYVYNVRGREKYVLDENNDKIPLAKKADGTVLSYKTFTVWYMRLAYPVTNQITGKKLINTTIDDGITHYWYDFEITDSLLINGKSIGCSFEANFNTGALSTPLAGRGTNGDYVGFELTYHKDDFLLRTSDDVEENEFHILAGDYEIVYQQDNDIFIPTNASEKLIPRGESLPSLKCNITVLYNIAMAESIYIQDAQTRLLDEALKEIKRLRSDLNNYTIKSYPHVFADDNPCLQIGQGVTYDDGNGYILKTRVLKLSTNIDFDYLQEITLGNQSIKGTITQLKDDVQSIIAGGDSNDGGSYTASQVANLIARYGTRYFLSKKNADTAKGRIMFAQGLDSNGEVNINNDLHAIGDISTDANLRASKDATIGGDLNVKGNTSLKDLTVTGSAHFFELVIDKIKAAGGTYIFSAANSFNVERVAVGSDVVRLYWLAEANGNGSMNTWEVGDQAISMDFNRAKVGSTFSASNKYWWALVTATSGNTPETITEDGADHLYHWIEVSTIEKADGCTVEAEIGDAVAQLGSRGADKKRQAAQMIAAYKSPDTGVEAPCWVQYVGINSFAITEDNRLNRVAYNGNVFKGSFVAMSEGEQGRDLLEWLESLQHDTDAHFDIWYGEGVPTLENEPAVEWATDNQKAAHVDDLYFDRSDTAKSDGGHCYRFVATTKDGTTAYSWEDYTDHDTLKALTKAQSIADDGIITAGTEKAQLLITRKNMEAEHSSFSAPTDPKSTYGTAYNLYTKAYNAFMTATADIVSEANIGKDTSLEDIGLTASGYTELYYNYYTSLAKVREASEASIKASISTIGGKVNLAVTKDGLKTAGMTVEDEHISLDAKKTTVKGDLTVQGALTNSTSYVSTDGSLWSPNDVGELEKQPDNLLTAGGSLFVPINMTSIKSVQIQTSDPSLVSDGSPTSASTALVTLPMYAAADLGCGVTVPAYRRSGTHVLIRNGFSLAYNQWSKSDGWTDAALRRNIEAAAVYVCSDPRALALSNYTASYPTVAPDGRDANGKFATADWFKGCMYLNGRRGRWLALLPGQQVELVSVITMWQTGSNTPVPYLGWYVVGGEGMDWLEKTISFEPPSASHNRYDAIFRSGVTGGEHFGVGSADKFADTFFGYGQLSDTETLTETIVVTLSEDDKPSISIG